MVQSFSRSRKIFLNTKHLGFANCSRQGAENAKFSILTFFLCGLCAFASGTPRFGCGAAALADDVPNFLAGSIHSALDHESAADIRWVMAPQFP
jgi:hypothetical protein